MKSYCLLVVATIFLINLLNVDCQAQAYSGGQNTRSLITQPIDESKLVSLPGNTRSEANAANDHGAVADNLPLEHLQLQLQRPPELEQQLEQFMAEQQHKGSPVYHQWLTAEQFGQRFGVSRQDVERVTGWLESHGFQVNAVYPSGMVIEFSGIAAQVKEAFHTEIHNLEVHGQPHIANMSDPQIPAAVAGVVKGVPLNNFMPHPMFKRRPQFDVTYNNTDYYAVVPSDLGTIYNLNPAFSAGYTGAGQTVVVIEDTNIQNAGDVATFRSAFGLSGYSGTFTQVQPSGLATCSNPGVNGDESEAALDAEWSGAAAPDTAIELASCADTLVFGGLIALQNLVNSATPPPVVSVSYGECEAENGSAANASYVSTYQQAASEGVSVFVSAGDEGAASCDADEVYATHGIAVSGFASTPYNVAVGGTDFGDTYASMTGGPPVSAYWNSSNSSTFGSVISYLPEIPWNDSCASELIFSLQEYTQAYGSTGFCNSTTGGEDYLNTASGSGGPSTYSAKPSWQSLVGNPGDGQRDLPDLSLFAADGVWNHFYVFCLSDTAEGGTPCNYSAGNAYNILHYLAAGGTSFASPIMAGIQSLVNEAAGSVQGNPNPRYYALANWNMEQRVVPLATPASEQALAAVVSSTT